MKMNSNRVRELRIDQKISQQELARRTKIASQNISSIERGRLMPWEKAKKAIAKALKLSVEEVFPADGK